MNESLTARKRFGRTILLFLCAHAVSCAARINYDAVIAETARDTGTAKAALSVGRTGSFLSYGAGQVVSGFRGDRFQPKGLVTAGLSGMTLLNLLIPLCAGFHVAADRKTEVHAILRPRL